jgi:hypothetical protein
MSRGLLAVSWLLVGCTSVGGSSAIGAETFCAPEACGDDVAIEGEFELGLTEPPQLFTFRVCDGPTCTTVRVDPQRGTALDDASLSLGPSAAGSSVWRFRGVIALPRGSVNEGDVATVEVRVGDSPVIGSGVTQPLHVAPYADTGCNAGKSACRQALGGKVMGCGRPECVSGETKTEDCEKPGQHRTRLCSAACAWNEWSACAEWEDVTPPDGLKARTDEIAVCTGHEVFIGGGATAPDPVRLRDAWSFDLDTRTWIAWPLMPGHAWCGDGAALDGVVYALCDGEPFELASDGWKALPSPPAGVIDGMQSSTMVVESPSTHEILFVARLADAAAAYAPATRTWRSVAAPPMRADDCIAWASVDGRAACMTGKQPALQLYDALESAWHVVDLPTTRLVATSLHGGPLAWTVSGDALLRAMSYDAAALSWNTSSPVLPTLLALPTVSGVASGRAMAWSNKEGTPGIVSDGAGGFRALPQAARPSNNAVVIPCGDRSFVWSGSERRGAIVAVE